MRSIGAVSVLATAPETPPKTKSMAKLDKEASFPILLARIRQLQSWALDLEDK